ncbi:pheromone precursor [Trametes coccinea BRFM310]|uniref:Pheromone n=1 Tax=Trametes coccinea (strain BRFM310) TaxID=1353009 RepID=A0A1Y2IRW8_TRAC3|nr:pheromone precursor [Trametes coccinea BRFM310]
MDEFSFLTVTSDDLVDQRALDDTSTHTSMSFSSSAQRRDALFAAVASSTPVNEDRIEGYNGYCVIA